MERILLPELLHVPIINFFWFANIVTVFAMAFSMYLLYRHLNDCQSCIFKFICYDDGCRL